MREEYKTIVAWVKKGSSVIDLGCGNGELLKMLKEQKYCDGIGIDYDGQCVKDCREKGLRVYNASIDEGVIKGVIRYSKKFDYAICNATLQMLDSPAILLRDMFRISTNQIISFPNFAKWQNRLELLFRGRMPRWMLSGYSWYNTEHIHQLSIKDFEEYIKDRTIVEKHFSPDRKILRNLTTYTAIYWLR